MKRFLICATAAFLFSCTNDTDTPANEFPTGNIVIGATLANPDGQSGSSYIQLIDNMDANTYTNDEALPVGFGLIPIMKENAVYEIPFFGTGQIKRYVRSASGLLTQSGQLNVDPSAYPSQIAIKDDSKAYISLNGQGKIVIVDPQTLEQKGMIDISSYGAGDDNPDPAAMIIRGDKLYVGLNQFVGGFMAAQDRPQSDVLIIDTNTDTVIKMISEETSGISQITRPADAKSIFMDENNDIYLVGVGAFGIWPTHKAGILRIKEGQTEFDTNYSFNLTDATIDGLEFNLNWVVSMQYLEGGKLYALVNVPALQSNPPNFVEDKSSVPVVIDLVNKTVKKLEVPNSTGYTFVGKYQDDIVFGLTTTIDTGFYVYNTSTNQTTSSAAIETVGSPIFFGTFE